MVVAPVDSPIIRSREVQDMLDQYEEKFGERFIAFNYGDFHRIGDKCAAQVYKEILEKALQDNKPYHIVSHRYDDFDH